MARTPDVVVVDHHDSYTGNLVHLVAGVSGRLPTVLQHDECEPADVLAHEYVVLSPGPGHPADPDDFAVGREVIRDGSRPLLGVCLGLQGLVTAYGGRVERVRPGHGVDAVVDHDGAGLFAGLPAGFRAVRYHSLAAVALPAELRRTATDRLSGLTMGVAHVDRPQVGVQFHPESILSEHGAALVANFLGVAA
ncbi:aminodeoxychorismate/anthranilate synthase component II [Nocardioides panacisoli]|uniref:anthranilate synthase component II n=1 Tax=Nocardioides panacisoli TaxID=627624 RepID=UPI001C625432|nr:aminodeoxychorismate/anthranilate synthase component II [Nocardioides panacisoli]QYJ03164.1 aminodeoxychorismate/anthranilate synthase component II [Nocardioides panacisoli]